MAQSKDTSKSSASPKPARRTRRKPRPVTIDLEATEVAQDKPESPESPESKDSATNTETASESSQTEAKQSEANESTDNPADGGAGGLFSMNAKTALHSIPYALAALFGGVLSLLIYFWFAGMGWLPGTAGPETTRMSRDIGFLRSNVEKMSGELETITGETIDGARSRLTALETGTAKIGVVNALEERVAALQTALSDVSALGDSNAQASQNLTEQLAQAEAALASTNKSIAALEGQIAEIAQISGNTELSDLINRISALETVLKDATTASDSTSPAGALQIAGLRNDLQTAIDGFAAAQQTLQTKVTAMDSQLIALQKSTRDLAADMSNVNNAANERLQAMDNALAGLEIRRDAGPVSQIERRAAMALSFTSLARAVDSGETYRNELDTARAFAGEQPALDVLEPYADNGIETVKSLTDRFDSVAAAIIDADAVSTEGGLLDRFWGKLQSIVRVRPTGFVAGETSAAIVARAESNLTDGELTKAIDELETLSGQSLAAAQNWLESARARRDSNAALQSLNADLIAAINSGAGTTPSSDKDANQ